MNELQQIREQIKQLTFEADASIYIIEKMLIEIRGMGEKTIEVFPLEGMAIKQLIETYRKLEAILKSEK